MMSTDRAACELLCLHASGLIQPGSQSHSHIQQHDWCYWVIMQATGSVAKRTAKVIKKKIGRS